MLDFSRIVALRGRRRDRAERELAQARQAFARAGQQLLEAQKVVDDFLEATQTLEITLLTEVLNKAVTINDLLIIEEKLRQTREKAEKLAQLREEARARLKEAGDNADAAAMNRNHLEARLNKSLEMNAELQLIERQEAIAHEDAEMDEFSEMLVVAGREP